MKRIKRPILFTFFAFLVAACSQWDLDEQDFVQLSTPLAETFEIDSIRLTTGMRDLVINDARDHGFIGTDREELPTLQSYSRGLKISLNSLTKGQNGDFSANIGKLKANTTYTFRAFLVTETGQEFFSEPLEYKTGNGRIMTKGTAYKSGDQVSLLGEILDTEKKGVEVIGHGFAWSTSNPMPTKEDSDDFEDLGSRNNNGDFKYEVDVENEVPLTFRAFVEFRSGEIFYGEPLVFDSDLNFWTEKADHGAGEIALAVGFAIGNKGYIGTGAFNLDPFPDFQEYDPSNDTWKEMNPFPGILRSNATGFSANGKGYIGLGFNTNTDEDFKDLWEFTPDNNRGSWRQVADFPSSSRSDAIGFSINGKGYVGLGFDGEDHKDFYEFTPNAGPGSWSQVDNFPGSVRSEAVAFVIGNKAYVGTGRDDFQSFSDFYEFDPSKSSGNQWRKIKDLGNDGEDNNVRNSRYRAVAFSINGKGYVGTGLGPDEFHKDFYEYDPLTDTWTQRADFAGGRVYQAVGFAIESNNKGYVGTGFNGLVEQKYFFEFDP